VFEGKGAIGEYVGGYSDWLQQKKIAKPAGRTGSAPAAKPATETAPASKPKKLSYKDQRELDGLPKQIEALDAEQAQLQEALGAPGFYQQDKNKVAATLARLEAVGEALDACYSRWEALESGA
jgi:ATP-binding cassette subfamily F protein uup